MAIQNIASIAGSQAAQATQKSKASFGKTMEAVGPKAHSSAPRPAAGTNRTVPVFGEVPGAKLAQPAPAARAQKVAATSKVKAAGAVLDGLGAAQSRMDKILALAQSGKSFTPAELLALQAQVSNASQQLDLAGKVVEKATGGIKQVLQTQV